VTTPFAHDPFGAEHERARRLAADRISVGRLGEALDDTEAAWLAAHLAWCAPCRAVHDEYEAQRVELRSLRLDEPLPPRNLWARTAVALDRTRPVRPVATLDGSGAAVVRGRSPAPVGAMSAMLVVALVVGVSMLGGARILRPEASAAPRQQGVRPAATPFAVPVREVKLYSQVAEGRLALVTGRIDEICPLSVPSPCTSGRLAPRRVVDVGVSRAHAVLESPTRPQLVVVGRDADGSGVDVYVVPLQPRPGVPAPSPTAQAEPTTDPSGDPGAVAASPEASAVEDAASPSAGTSASPPASEEGVEPGGSPAPSESEPDSTAEDAEVVEVPTEPSPRPLPTPIPGTDTLVRVASEVQLVVDIGSYSGDGSAFAFTARPADGRQGPDVYLWRLGEPAAVAITTDHASVFADWLDGLLLISRVSGDIGPDGTQQPVTVLVDPSTGLERVVPMAAGWRPSVDPTGRTAVWWAGTVRRDSSASGWQAATGRLVLGSWRGPGGPSGESDAVPARDVLVEGAVGEWQARWDETGTRLAIWVAEPGDPSRGRLSLYGIDAQTGRIDPSAVLLRDEPALAGFSIGGGRLAWLHPAESGISRIGVVAWTETLVGRVDLVPETAPLMVVR